MQDFLWNIDLSIFKFINQTLSFGWLDQITPILTNLDQYRWFMIALLIISLFFFVKKYKRTGITYFLFLVLAVSMSDFAGGKIKKVVLRPRPFQVEETRAIQKAEAAENRSFYSNHSSNMFTAANYLTAFFPGAQIYFFTTATIIALTRIHVGVHYPSDVLFGSLMGLMWGFLFSRLIKFLIAKAKRQGSDS
jgi:undecaprenyl-diphosphatase